MSSFFNKIRTDYTNQKTRRSVLKHVRSVAKNTKIIRELDDHIIVLNKSIARLENLYPKWTIDFTKKEPPRIDLSYSDLKVSGISELYKTFRSVFKLLLPEKSRKLFSTVMTDYMHQYVNENKMPTFVEERERFINYIKTKFEL